MNVKVDELGQNEGSPVIAPSEGPPARFVKILDKPYFWLNDAPIRRALVGGPARV
jgi:hypothetical protein